MEHNLPYTERRKHPRYRVKSLVIAVPNKTQTQVARIADISKGGMAVHYVDQDNWLGEAKHVDILVNSDFLLTGIPVEAVRDVSIDAGSFFSIIKERQCCLSFGSLTRDQENLLDEFILKHTAGNS